MKDTTQIYKWVAILAVGVYLYKASKSNGGTLSGNSYGINAKNLRMNGDKIVESLSPWLGISNPLASHAIKTAAKHILKRV